jgi:hypothetical protein
MSFNQGASSGSLSFRPARYDVEWDGVSEAKASFEMACGGTGVSYAAKAYRVFRESGSIGCEGSGQVEYVRGERYYNLTCPGNAKTFASDITLPTTVSGGAVSVTFSAITNTVHAYAWQLTATKGGATRIVVGGKLEAVGLNPYAPGAGRISLVSGVTASGCL